VPLHAAVPAPLGAQSVRQERGEAPPSSPVSPSAPLSRHNCGCAPASIGSERTAGWRGGLPHIEGEIGPGYASHLCTSCANGPGGRPECASGWS
jgi:hypothetical protein